MSRLAAALVVAVTAVLAAGCGAGGGTTPGGARLTVTDGFGTRTLLELAEPEVRPGDTVMRLLQRNARVQARYGGGFVQAIDGLRGGRRAGRPVDWFFYVNGVLAEKGAASVRVSRGERIWWDRRDWGATATVPAVVGSFPEPFLHGIGGERLPMRLECDERVDAACDVVTRKLSALEIVVGRARPGTELGEGALRLLVGLWPVLRRDRAAEQLERGPKASGVYARIAADGRTITALDESGRATRSLGPGTGLVAATRWREDEPVWIVTGTDVAGVKAAAEAMDESVLAEKFALAIRGGLPIALPDKGRP